MESRIGIVSTVRTPQEQLLMFVRYHLNLGVDHVVLFFDDAEDVGASVFNNESRVTAVVCTSLYWREQIGNKPNAIEDRQIVNANLGAKILSSHNCQWLIHIDSDELLHSKNSIKHIFNNCDHDGIRFTLLEALPTKEKYGHIFKPTLFKKKAGVKSRELASLLGCRNTLLDGEYFRGHTSSKMAVRMSDRIKQFKIHDAEAIDGHLNVYSSPEIFLLHYDCVGIESWKEKWDRRIDGSGMAKGLRKNRAKQMQLYQEAKIKGDHYLTKLYRRLYLLPVHEVVLLWVIGLLKRVSINKTLFDAE